MAAPPPYDPRATLRAIWLVLVAAVFVSSVASTWTEPHLTVAGVVVTTTTGTAISGLVLYLALGCLGHLYSILGR